MASVHEQLRSCNSHFYGYWGMDCQNPMEKPSLAWRLCTLSSRIESLAKTAYTFATANVSE